jgi:hypothetical protein
MYLQNQATEIPVMSAWGLTNLDLGRPTSIYSPGKNQDYIKLQRQAYSQAGFQFI